MDNFTEEELIIAKSVDLCDVAKSLGYTVKRVGRFHTIKEMDSVRIYDRTSWFRWSRLGEKGNNGGSQIDFLRVFAGLSVKEAVFWLLDFANYRRHNNIKLYDKKDLQHVCKTEKEEKKPFVLPGRADGNSFIYPYLTKERMIDKDIVQYFIDKDLIYEETGYHNIVFKGVDKDGTTKFASRRGVFDNREKPFKRDVAGSDKQYGFNVVTGSDCVVVFEGAIDLLSNIDLYKDFETNKLALGMLSDEPLRTILKEHPNIKRIMLCLDNDEPGKTATKRIINKYTILGYEVEDCSPPSEFKDYNDYLKNQKRMVTFDKPRM